MSEIIASEAPVRGNVSGGRPEHALLLHCSRTSADSESNDWIRGLVREEFVNHLRIQEEMEITVAEPIHNSVEEAVVDQSLSTSMKPCPRRDLVDSEEVIDQQLFLYDEPTEDVHTLSSGAALVWLLCDGQRDVESIVGEIASYFELSEPDARSHVRGAVSLFQEQGLLVP